MSGEPPCHIDQLPNDLLGRMLVAAATDRFGGIDLRFGKALSQVCQRWRDLCFSAPELWQTVQLRAPSNEPSPDERQQWLDGKLWLLQRVGEHVRHLRITDQAVAEGVFQPLMRAAPCTLRSLQLSTERRAHLSELPQLLALARERFTSLGRLELTVTQRTHQSRPAQQQPWLAAQQLEATLLASVLDGVAALAGSLTWLKLYMPPVQLPSLAPLTALRRLRWLEVVAGNIETPLQMPALHQFLCLEEFDLHGPSMEVAGSRMTAASWVASPAGTLRLEGARVYDLPELLPALRPPGAAPLEKLFVSGLARGGFAAPAAAAMQASAHQLQHVCELDITLSDPGAALKLLRHQLPRLQTLRLAYSSLRTLTAGPYLSGLRTLSLSRNALRELPPALMQGTRLQQLDLRGNERLRASEAELLQLLQALPDLQLLDLTDTGIEAAAAAALTAAAAERGLTVQV